MGIKKPQLVKVEAFNIFYIGGFATPSLPLGRVFYSWRGGWKDFKGRLLPVYLWGAGAAAAC